MSIFPEDFDPHDVDFDALYQGGQLVEGVDLPSVPWDIGAAQPVVIEAERAGRFHGAVLDLGCGLADTTGISEQNLRTTWGKAGWDITSLRPATYHVNADAGELVTAMGFECEPVPGEAGRLQAPVWALQARRA